MKELNLYYNNLCSNCKNFTIRPNESFSGCPIHDMHINQTMFSTGNLEWKEENQDTLDSFIPVISTKKGYYNKNCIMFLPTDEYTKQVEQEKLNFLTEFLNKNKQVEG